MTQQSKFTPGLKAARQLLADGFIDENTMMSPVDEVVAGMAKVINDKTKAPEMYELLSTIIKWYENSGSTEPCAGSVDLWSAARRIKAAIDGEVNHAKRN